MPTVDPNPPGTNPPGNPPGNTTTGGSSGGSGGSSGPSLAEQRAIANLRASFTDLLRRWGLPRSKNLLNLIERGIRSQWNSALFIDQLRHTPEYRQKFRGIQWKTGMTEGAYLSTFAQYKARAQDIGVTLTRNMFAKLIKQGKSFEEFSAQIDALDMIQSYGPFWQQFGQTLEMRGVNIPGRKLTKSELAKFIMGMGSKKWEQVFQEMVVTTQLEQVAGINVVERLGGETTTDAPYEILRSDMLKLIRQAEALNPGFEVEKMTGQDWAAIGEDLSRYKPEYLKRYGLDAADILTIKLGGPGAAELMQKANRVLATQEAYFEPRALPGTGKLGQQAFGGGGEEDLVQSL